MPPRVAQIKTALVINTRSRKAERFFFRMLDLLIEKGLDVELFPVREPEKLSETVAAAIRHGNKRIILGGGDGTISAMIKHFVHTNVTLAILPLGTANSFIKSLGISHKIDDAVETILHGKTVRIDVGKCNSTYFANAASFGFSSLVAENISHGLKKYFGSLAYALEGVRQAFRMCQFHLIVVHKNHKERFLSSQVVIANGSFYGPTALAPIATVNNAKLVLIALKDSSRFRLFWAWIKSLFGTPLSESCNYELVAESFTLKTTPQQPVTIDGELQKEKELHFSVVPGSVKVLVPQSFRQKKSR